MLSWVDEDFFEYYPTWVFKYCLCEILVSKLCERLWGLGRHILGEEDFDALAKRVLCEGQIFFGRVMFKLLW